MFLQGLRRKPEYVRPDVFPWSLPFIAGLETVQFNTPVTFLVGENGCGKSTFLEGIAAGMGAVAAGSDDVRRDPSLTAAREFANGFRFLRLKRPVTKMFLRAEDVFGFTRRVQHGMDELRQFESEFASELPEGSGRQRATGLMRAQRREFSERYGENPDGRSHGETFLGVLEQRLAPHGLYLLDEPETPLSPARVLALLAMLLRCAAQGSQFVIATHSPILMALPNARILSFDEGVVAERRYEDVEHVRITRDFLAAPERYLRHLVDSDA